jgi:hypothetical protein
MAADVFVSYSRRDQERVQCWLDRLQAAGVSTWIDVRGIDGATLWGKEIVDAIERCRVLMLMLSEASAASPQVVKEVSLAAESNRHILPLLLEPVVIPSSLRYHLAGLQQIELFGGDPEEKFQAIVRAIDRLGLERQGPVGAEAGSLPAPARHGISHIYLLQEQYSSEQMRERAWDQKMNVFGGLINMIFRPRSEEIQLGQSEKRHEPFWHVNCRNHYIYERDQQFVVSTSGPAVKCVAIEGREYPVRDQRYVILAGTEHCQEHPELEAFIDGLTGERRSWKQYLGYPRREVYGFRPEDGLLRPPTASAAAILRRLLGEAVRRDPSHRVLENSAEILALDLYFRPVYAFEYRWPAKGRNAVALFDGLTGEMSAGGELLHGQAGHLPEPEGLFDVGCETTTLTLPGSAAPITVRPAVPEPRAEPAPSPETG